MRRIVAVGLAAWGIGLSGPSVATWGFDVHRDLTARAIERLPAELRPFYERHRVYLIEHSIDADLWRKAGFEEEPPHHFLDLDAYGAFPFDALPRDRAAAEAKFGRETVARNGLLPWRAVEMFDRLVASFATARQEERPFAREDVLFYSAALAHYVQDAHVPFHAVMNYDGQLTGQHGVHARFETELFVRFERRLQLPDAPIPAVDDVRSFVFDRLVEGVALAEVVLEADRTAMVDRDRHDDRYYAGFFPRVRELLERRLAESVAAVAGVLAAAWQRAGRPDLPDGRRPAARRPG